MAALGYACLVLALAVCAYGIGASVHGARSGQPQWCQSGRRAVYLLAGVLTLAFLVLEQAFLRSDFAFNTVADTSSRTTPTFYKAAAVWSSQEGSLLLWAWLMSLWSSLALFLTRHRLREIAAYATAVLLGLGGITAEALADVAVAPAPISERAAAELAGQLAGRALLDGFRGGPVADRAQLGTVLAALGNLLADHPAIADVEINPLRVTAAGLIALDAVLTMGKEARS